MTRLVLTVALFLAGALALRVALWRPFELTGNARDDGFVRVPGVVHVHTTLSDGGGTPDEVITAARAAGLRFVAITDHNNADAKLFEGYHDGVLVLVGSELSTTAGHLVALGIPDPQFRFSGDVQDGLADIRDLGGVALAAHPWSSREDFRWSGWDQRGPWGIELMNLDSEWRVAGWPRLAGAAIVYGLNHRYGLLSGLGASGGNLAAWDALLAERDVPGIVGTDAHSRIPVTKTRSLRFPSYESLFLFAQNHVLLDAPLGGDGPSDAARVLDALRRGASYAAVDALAPADGFSFTVESERRRFTMGETAPLALSRRLVAGGRLPAHTRLTLLRDGKTLTEREGSIDLPVPGPGVYRVEARISGWTIPWVLSNPIYVVDDATRAARAARAAWPREPEPPPSAQLFDTFEGRTIFGVGCDTASWLRPGGLLDPAGGADGHGAGRIDFRLGAPSPDHPDTFCEIANRDRRNLTGRTGLVLSIKGDRAYRMWVQVHDDNPASLGGGEWWFASVRTSPVWRRVGIPFAAFRSMDSRTDGRLDLDKVRALVFVVDRGAVKVGTAGTIWIDDVGVYRFVDAHLFKSFRLSILL